MALPAKLARRVALVHQLRTGQLGFQPSAETACLHWKAQTPLVVRYWHAQAALAGALSGL